jgi:two-component system NarL family sensor kinase
VIDAMAKQRRTGQLLTPEGAAFPDGAVGEEHPRKLALLNAITEALHSSTDVQQALERTLGLVAGLLGLRTGWVWLVDPETSQFYVAAAQRLPPYLQEPVRMSGRWCLCTDLFSKGKLTPSNVDMLECSRLHPAIHAQDPNLTQGLRYHATVPLYFRDRPLGIMNIAGPAFRPLDPAELRLLTSIASQIGIAVERARLAEESTRLARAEERTRLAREIHDTLAQGLTAIGLDIEGALRHLEESPERARDRLERALATTRASLEEARHSVLDLRAAALAGRPLAEALAALGRAFTSETGIQVHVQAAVPNGNDDAALSLRIEAELYRIAQEGLSNVRQHARATSVEIVLRTTPQSVLLSIRDDGVGLSAPHPDPLPKGEGMSGSPPPRAGDDVGEADIRAAQRSGVGAPSGLGVGTSSAPGVGASPGPGVGASSDHHGILGMRERARLLGGRLRVTSRPGHGTTVSARIPRGREGEA